jgi:hypothetical protein
LCIASNKPLNAQRKEAAAAKELKRPFAYWTFSLVSRFGQFADIAQHLDDRARPELRPIREKERSKIECLGKE